MSDSEVKSISGSGSYGIERVKNENKVGKCEIFVHNFYKQCQFFGDFLAVCLSGLWESNCHFLIKDCSTTFLFP